MLHNLPKELLYEIFDYLPITDLLTLSTVCQTFNIFINNTKLVEKFTLSFDRDFNTRDWIGSRKYTRLSIEIDTGAFGILRAIGEDIKHIEISAKSIDLKTISRILSLCPNMTVLKFVDVKTHSCLDLMKRRDMPRHTSLELWIENTTPNILEIFRFVEVRKLTLLAPTSMSDFGVCWNVDDCRVTFNNFMRSQRSLRHLDMRNFKSNASIFSDKGLDEVPFRLTRLKLQNFAITNTNFQQFLANHAPSLEAVSVDSKSMTDDFVMFLSQCVSLSYVHFSGNLKTHRRSLRSVRKLRAELTYSQANWTDMFPGLSELKISSSCENSFGCLERLTRLERLEIHNSHFYEEKSLSIPSVRWLTLRDITFDSAHIFRSYPARLEELNVESSSVAFLVNFLALNGVSLKRLVIRNPFMLHCFKGCLNLDPQRVASVKVYEFIAPALPSYEDYGEDDDYY